jgi:hypothetical protein
VLTHPVLLEGGCHVDACGSISFANGFTFDGVERFYWVQSAQVGIATGMGGASAGAQMVHGGGW